MPYEIKVTWAFAGQEQGWSESWYYSSLTDNLASVIASVTDVSNKRAALLASGYTLTVLRVGVVKNNAGQPVLRKTDTADLRKAGIPGWAPATPNLALLVDWQTSGVQQVKKAYMRGIPAGLGALGKKPLMTYSNFQTAWNNYESALVAIGAGWLTTAATQSATINSYVMNANTGIVQFTLSAPGITWPVNPGQPTRVYVKLPGKSPLDGPLIVSPGELVGGGKDPLKCFSWKPVGVGPQWPGTTGTMQIRQSTLVDLLPPGPNTPPGNLDPKRIVSHKTGRPTYASRGRAPARPEW